MIVDAILPSPAPAMDPEVAPWSGREAEVVLLVHRQMRALAGPRPDLDDLVQSALEQVLRARFEGRSRFSTFTHAICYRVWMKHLRSAYRWQAVFSFGWLEDAPEPVDERTPQGAIEAHERLRRFYAALDKVSPKRRAVVVLHDLSGEEVPAIAAIVGTSEANVRTRLRDGRNRLREVLRRDPYFAAELEEERR